MEDIDIIRSVEQRLPERTLKAPRVVVTDEELGRLLLLARRGVETERRVRGRNDLVAQIVMVLTTAAPAMDAPQRINIAERVIDALGKALLVDGEGGQTANMPTGEKEEMTVDEFLEREGRGHKQR